MSANIPVLQNCLNFKPPPNLHKVTQKTRSQLTVCPEHWACFLNYKPELISPALGATKKCSPLFLPAVYFCVSAWLCFLAWISGLSCNGWAWWSKLTTPKPPSWHITTTSGGTVWCFMVGLVTLVLLLAVCLRELQRIAEASQGMSSLHSAIGDE